jgi:hypothetical protein
VADDENPSEKAVRQAREAERAWRDRVDTVRGLSPQNSTYESAKLDPETILSNADLSRYGYRTGTVPMPEVPKPMPTSVPNDSNRNFAVAVAIYTGTIVTGLLLLGEASTFSIRSWYGVVYVAGGGVGVMSVTALFSFKARCHALPKVTMGGRYGDLTLFGGQSWVCDIRSLLEPSSSIRWHYVLCHMACAH